MSRRSFDDAHGASDAARQGLLDNRCEHKTKRHRTRKRSKALKAKKRQRAMHRAAVATAKHRRWAAAARAYWRGERDEHPG